MSAILNEVRVGAPAGASPLVPTSCTGPSGPANVDGQCIRGGLLLASSSESASPRCTGNTVYLLSGVPYSRGRVAGNSYDALANMYSLTRLRDTA